MKCQKCNQREANTHITKIINGKKSEYFLCDKCAKESGEMNIGFASNWENDWNNFFGGLIGNTLSPFAPQTDNVCPNCGMKLSEFLNGGRLGCGKCYDAFGSALSRPIRQIHGEAAHEGKIPKRGGSKISTETKIRSLKRDLDRAVEEQEFEKAAQLRDEIKELEKGGNK